jgi:hypothetical protein
LAWPWVAMARPAQKARVRLLGLTPGTLLTLAGVAGAGGVALLMPPNPPTMLRLANMAAVAPVGNALAPPVLTVGVGVAGAGGVATAALVVVGVATVVALFLAMAKIPLC